MGHLGQGQETEAKIDTLLKLTKITGERKIKALKLHFVDGLEITHAAMASKLPQPNVTEVVDTLKKVAEHAERYHELRVDDFSPAVLARLEKLHTS